tara:strand:- start:1980 stop:2921 length:942 start_codon:yes stop_codon:yes gene_type:complete
MDKNLKEEAKAFNQRTEERRSSGFVPDLRNIKENNFFYKSFWRTPLATKLYVGEIHKTFLDFFNKYSKKKRILDVGCGTGYHALELARDGFDVTGIDISSKSINLAKETAEKSKISLKGQLEYKVGDYSKISNLKKFDIILSSGFMHHLTDLRDFVAFSHKILDDDGILVFREPQHEKWQKIDASIVAILRLILSEVGLWYEENLSKKNKNFSAYTNDIYQEFVTERDKNEKGGQSPNDISCDKGDILREVNKKFIIVEEKPSFSFIYRFLGGLRGKKDKVDKLSKLLYEIDKSFVKDKILQANYFFGVAKKK